VACLPSRSISRIDLPDTAVSRDFFITHDFYLDSAMYEKLFPFILLILAGCGMFESSVAAVPGVYRGTLPCADCEGIETILTLRPNGVFELSRHYRKRERFTAPLQTGTWQRRDRVIELFPHAPTPATANDRLCFGLEDSGVLVQFDIGCAPIEGLAGVLERADGYLEKPVSEATRWFRENRKRRHDGR
jgi:hypothetical protein